MPAKKRVRKIVTYKDAKAALASLSPDELSAKKNIILMELATGPFDREQAALNVGLTIKELRYLVSQDDDFKAHIAAIKDGNDDSMADLASRNLREVMEGEASAARNQVSMYVDKTRGNYGVTQKIQYEGVKKIDPVDLSQHTTPDSIPAQIPDKPKKQKKIAKIPPDEAFSTGPSKVSWQPKPGSSN